MLLKGQSNSMKYIDDFAPHQVNRIKIFDDAYAIKLVNKPLRLKCLLYMGIGHLSFILGS